MRSNSVLIFYQVIFVFVFHPGLSRAPKPRQAV
jgi:hypothetical protein